ncbi:NXPE family member 3-like [Ptychodera flava]|uniref:NXPE family member 3-like n=1 Tax=Ptychodera flava TaxID=63121 RepID=UPI00396A5C96
MLEWVTDSDRGQPDSRRYSIIPSTANNVEQVRNCEGVGEVDFFPYNKYTPYGMEWTGLIDELEWEYQHTIYGRDKLNRRSRDWSFSIGDGSLGMTSPDKTRVTLQNGGDDFRRGDFIHVVVEAFDENGRPRRRGGDFFEAVMERESPQYRSTAGRVIDYLNGTYSVFFYAAWSGKAVIGIEMTFTREAIHFLNTNVRQQDGRIFWNVVYRKGDREANSTCYLSNEGTWSDVCEYSIPAAIGKSVYLCNKPQGMDCQDILTVKTSISQLDEIAERFNAQAKNPAYFGTHGGHVRTIEIHIKESEAERPFLPKCGPDMPVPLSDGFWSSRKTYSSLVCRARQWSVEDLKRCLAGRKIILFGDSTLGQIGRLLENRLGYTNAIHYFHDFKVGPRDTFFWDQNFGINVVDSVLKEPCNSTVFVVNACFHFAAWSTRAHIERLIRLKHALKRLVTQCPKMPVIVKSSNPRENHYAAQSIHSNNWIFYDMNRMMRKVFGGLSFMFVDVWDMSLSHWSEPQVHMHSDVIEQEIHLLTSYLCPE